MARLTRTQEPGREAVVVQRSRWRTPPPQRCRREKRSPRRCGQKDPSECKEPDDRFCRKAHAKKMQESGPLFWSAERHNPRRGEVSQPPVVLKSLSRILADALHSRKGQDFVRRLVADKRYDQLTEMFHISTTKLGGWSHIMNGLYNRRGIMNGRWSVVGILYFGVLLSLRFEELP